MLAHAWQELTGRPAQPLLATLPNRFLPDLRQTPWHTTTSAKGPRGWHLRSLLIDLAGRDARRAVHAAQQLETQLTQHQTHLSDAAPLVIPMLATILEHADDAREEAILTTLLALARETHGSPAANPPWFLTTHAALRRITPNLTPYRLHENPAVADLADAILEILEPTPGQAASRRLH